MAPVNLDRVGLDHAANIAAGGEDALTPGEHDAAGPFVLAQLAEIGGEPRLLLEAQGVGGLGAVQGQPCHALSRPIQQNRRRCLICCCHGRHSRTGESVKWSPSPRVSPSSVQTKWPMSRAL